MRIINTVAMALLMFAMLMVGSTDAFGQLPQVGEAPVDGVEPRIVVDSEAPVDGVEPRIVVDGEVPVDGVEPRIVVDGEAPVDGVESHTDGDAPDPPVFGD